MDPYYPWNSDVSVLYSTHTRKGFLVPREALFLFPLFCLPNTPYFLSTPPKQRCTQPAEKVLTTSEEISEWTWFLARLDAQNYPDLAAVVPVNWHSTSSNLRVIARSLELIKYRIRKLTLINENNLSLNLYIFWTGVHKHFDMRMTMTLCTG